MARRWPTIYCEGPPGLGKSTAAIGLAASADPVVLVAENNPTPQAYHQVTGLDPLPAALWYLRTEARRRAYATGLAREHPTAIVVCDKGALATLAYIYALCATGRHPKALYDQVRDAYLDQVRPHLTTDTATIVFTGTVELSLARRRGKTDRHIRPVWFDPGLLHAQIRFYTHEAPALTPHPLIPFDATPDPVTVLNRLAMTIGAAGATPLRPVAPVEHHGLPDPFRAFAQTAGEEVLGRALGRPFGHLGHLAHAFERHLLLVDDDGGVYPQQQHWESRHNATPCQRIFRPERSRTR